MPLCTNCEALDLDAKQSRLGEYDALIKNANNGCQSCEFFCKVLKDSDNRRTRISELSGQVIFIYSKRIDVRKPNKVDRSTYCCDDLMLDYCVREDYTGVYLVE